jgi:hypothetical protein
MTKEYMRQIDLLLKDEGVCRDESFDGLPWICSNCVLSIFGYRSFCTKKLALNQAKELKEKYGITTMLKRMLDDESMD